MMPTIEQLFTRVPAEQKAAFNQAWSKTVTERLRWLFWVAVILQVVLLSTDAVRYLSGTLFSNPTHRALFVTHLVISAVWLIYGLHQFWPHWLP